MNILNALQQLRDDIKIWITNNLNALNSKIDEKTIPIDNELNSTSTNPVQNRVITNAINKISTFSGDYNDLTNAPNITEDESGNITVTDDLGNIIFKIDAEGAHTTSLTLNGQNIEEFINTKVGDSTGGILIETDPTIPAWAKEPTKPSYTASEVGLGNVNNTSDADKPVSTATQTALDNLKDELSESIVSSAEEWTVVDNNGNIVATISANGLETTAITTQNIIINGINIITELEGRIASLEERLANLQIAEEAEF